MPPIMATRAGEGLADLGRLGDVAAAAGRGERLRGVGARCRRSGPGCASSRRRCGRWSIRPDVVQGLVHLPVVGQAELAVQLGRDHRVARRPAAGLDQVELRPAQRLLDEPQLLLQQDLQQPVHPVGVLEGLEDQLPGRPSGSRRAASSRPGRPRRSRAGCPRRRRGRTPRAIACLVQPGHRHVLVDQVDVLVPLDQVLGDPGGRAVGRRSCRSASPPGVMMRVVDDLVVRVGVDDRRSRRATRASARRTARRWGSRTGPSPRSTGSTRPCPSALNAVQGVHAAHVRVEVVLLPLVDGDRQPVGLPAIERPHRRSLEVMSPPCHLLAGEADHVIVAVEIDVGGHRVIGLEDVSAALRRVELA